jgi:hypothetical protein
VPGDADANVQYTEEVVPPDRVTLEGHDAVSPEVVATARLTGPESPERLVTLRMLLPDDPEVNETDDEEMP